jgi:RNA-directed DNA polymerase
MAGFRTTWTWNHRSLRGLRVRQAHTRLMHGNRETSEGPARRWWSAGTGGNGRTRPLGIPSLEDKVVQQAARMILEPIYEQEFLGFSYGFRPGRSQHKALDALAVAIGRTVNWVLDADIRDFFNTINHEWMQKFIEDKVGDRRMVQLLMKWLHAGVVEDGELREVQEGAPQGGGISPLMSNIYLHYALDLWVQQWRKRNARREVYVVRYADDVVLGFQDEQDARAATSVAP